jgi:hypothetical protein
MMPAQRALPDLGQPALAQPDQLLPDRAQPYPAQHLELVQRPALRFEIGEYRATT